MIIPFLIGAVLAACGLAFVLSPLLFGSRSGLPAGSPPTDVPSGDAPLGGSISAVDVLREIEFDRATGKLSDADYGVLKSAYTTRALAELRAGRAAPTAAPASGAPLAAAVAHVGNGTGRRACIECGASSPPDALYCMRCAHYLAGRCPSCGASVARAAARFCSGCGAGLGQGSGFRVQRSR